MEITINKTEIKALTSLFKKATADVPAEAPAEDVNPFDASPSTPDQAPAPVVALDNDEAVFNAIVGGMEAPVVDAGTSMPVFASAHVVETPADVVETPTEEPVTDPQANAKALAKAQRKAENQAANRAINAQLANATKAHTSGDASAVVEHLNKAMGLVPNRKDKDGNFTWKTTIDRIVEKAHALGVA